MQVGKRKASASFFPAGLFKHLERGLYMTKLELLIGIIGSAVAVIVGVVLFCKVVLAFAKQCEEDMRKDKE